MKSDDLSTVLKAASVVGLLITSTASAQMTPERARALGARLQQFKATVQKLPPGGERVLSASSRNLFNLLALGTAFSPATMALAVHKGLGEAAEGRRTR